MKRHKILFLIIFLVFLCSGCTAEYTIEINEDLQVKEHLMASEDGEFFNQYENSSAQRVIGFILEPFVEYFNENHFVISQFANSQSGGVNISNTYESLETYKNVSKIPSQYASDWEYEENGDEITIRIKGEFNKQEEDQEAGFVVDDAKVNIKLPFEVVEHNADVHAEGSDTYTWVFNEDTPEREMTITFKKTIHKGTPLIYIVIGVSMIIVLVIFYLVMKMLKDNKLNNKI